MSKTDSMPSARMVSSINISAGQNKTLVWWLLLVCFAYHYKVIVCGFFGKDLGYDWLCHTLLHGITTNHWFEQLIYVPVLWYAWYRIIQIVFGPLEGEVLGPKVRKLKTMAYFLLVMYIYGKGIHMVNTVEIYAHQHLGISSGPLYDQIHWLDEHFSHWVQHFFFYALLGWGMACDRLDRNHSARWAVMLGILFGLERTIMGIEGDSPYLALVFGVFIWAACVFRWFRHGKNLGRAWRDFFIRCGMALNLTLPFALLLYYQLFDGFIQPSAMGKSGWQVVVFVAILAGAGFFLAIALDRGRKARS